MFKLSDGLCGAIFVIGYAVYGLLATVLLAKGITKFTNK